MRVLYRLTYILIDVRHLSIKGKGYIICDLIIENGGFSIDRIVKTKADNVQLTALI